MVSWNQTFARIRSLVRLLFLCPLLLGLLILFRIPAITYRWETSQQSFLISMLLMAISTFPISGWISRRFLKLDGISDPALVASRLRYGALLMAAMGEACAVYGWALYWFSGDTLRPWLFFLLSAGHYAMTMRRLESAAEEITR